MPIVPERGELDDRNALWRKDAFGVIDTKSNENDFMRKRKECA